jgi:glycosyltransferase involved in cell wall biosynthesis
MNKRPRISIITASKNGARFLHQTIESILQQTFTGYEQVVVDSNSTDNTVEILKEYKHIRWISEPDRHADEGFYKALQMAQGDYIMLCCVSDGYLDQDWFKKCVEILDNDQDISLVYGTAQIMMEDGTAGKVVCSNFLSQPPPQKMNFFTFWLGTFCLCPENTFCVRANVFRECFPKYEPSGYFLQNHALLSFNYNFNTKGYLPYFLPTVAAYGRYHHDSNSSRLARFNRIMKKQYQNATIQYANDVLCEKRMHLFRDGKTNAIKTIKSNELKFYRQKVLDYRINRKIHLGKKRTRFLHRWLRKIKILMCYYLCRYRIYD